MADAPYPQRQALRLTGLSKRFLDRLVEQRVLGSPDGQRFSHQDVVVGRTAKALRDAGVPPRKVLQALRHVKESLADGPLSAARLRPHAGAVELQAGVQRLDAHTGQALLPFDDMPSAGLSPLAPAARDASDWLREALRLEASDSAAAEAAYRQVLAKDACCAAAYVNLGALLCESRRCEEAVALYEQALDRCEPTALIHFNRATALEDVGRPYQAVAAYERALGLDPRLADAHYNLSVLLEKLGDGAGAVRHMSAYRRAAADAV